MKSTVTRTVNYKGCKLHARAVPHAGAAGFNAEVVVSTVADDGQDDHAVELKAWLHGSAEKAIQYGLSGGQDWIESHGIAGHAGSADRSSLRRRIEGRSAPMKPDAHSAPSR